jgi:molybdate transport system permease protein
MSNKIFAAVIRVATGLLAGLLLLFLVAIIGELFASRALRPLPAAEIWFAIRLSLLTATISSLTAVVFALPIAYGLTRNRFRFQKIIDTLLDLPLVLSPVALGAMILVFLNTGFGRFLETLAGGIVFNFKGLVVAQFFVVVGLAIRQLKLAFEAVDPEYEELARTLGCNRLQAFSRVTLPLAARGLVAAFMLVWARAVGEFGATITLAGATTMKTETIPTAIYLSFASADIHGAAIFILILVGVSLSLLYGTRKLTV